MPNLSKRIYYEIESKCNLQCIHCSDLLKSSKRKQISSSDLLKFHEIAVKKGIETCIITGGEPTLHNDFFTLVSELSKVTKVIITTNGTTLSIDDLKSMVIGNDNVMVQISLDGSTQETFEKIRGKNTYVKVEKLLKDIVKYEIANKVGISMTIMNENIQEVSKMISFCKDNGFSYVYFPVLLPVGNAKKSWKQIAPPIKKQVSIENEIIQNIIENKSITEISSNRIEQIISKINSCGESDCINELTIKITPGGYIYPCPISDEDGYYMGHINDVKQSSDIDNLIKEFNEYKVQEEINYLKLDECRDCSVYKYCKGRFCANCRMSGEKCDKIIKYNCSILKSHLENAIKELNG
ncbi:radical SAM/SPASM domain-containing protein [Breznakia pachnodae]|uniref:Radical SAM protein with 4Fe4S-binding SPASM domain n=1 Tax=Breznakia pachnodae TaxID=265178 RepID=A0ABU0E492_9FIRM|nr:radical SAM protein [Breznakia pachnodae]MDQ0361536.1 radical SAM protein with 4Fe4S-binding SPASM domain [Breznakia pachnodae]